MTLPREIQKTKNFIRGFHAPHNIEAPIIHIAGLNARYESGPALVDVSFDLKAGERVAVVGPNGAGKSTLFKVIAGVHPAGSGEVKIFGHGPGGHTCIAYLPQRSQVDWNFPVTVGDVVMMGRIGKIGLFRWPKPADWTYVRQCLSAVALDGLAERQIRELSGGQQQRMFIAQALAQEAELMLMDEPITGLDIQSKDDIFTILSMLQERNVTVMVSMHDLEMAAEYFDRVLLLNQRLVGIGPPGEVFTPDRLQLAYGSHLRLMETDGGMLAVSDTCCDDGVIVSED
jgi:ABC-type Mn2+/Zn2+ transport system ATPase subunit